MFWLKKIPDFFSICQLAQNRRSFFDVRKVKHNENDTSFELESVINIRLDISSLSLKIATRDSLTWCLCWSQCILIRILHLHLLLTRFHINSLIKERERELKKIDPFESNFLFSAYSNNFFTALFQISELSETGKF